MKPMTMRRIICDRYGEPAEALRVEMQPSTEPRSGELLVRMLARPINPSDLIPVRGSYAHRTTLPMIPGYEGVGVVVEAGDAANRSLIGRRVLPLRGEGTWQSLVRVPAATAVEVPGALSDDQAAQAYINPLTAWATCTDELALSEGDTLVINAGGSAIGRCYAQLSRRLGFALIAIVRDARHVEPLQRLGAAHVIVEGERSSPAAAAVASAAELIVGSDAVRESQEQVLASDSPHESRERMSAHGVRCESGELAAVVVALTGGRLATAAIDSVGGAAGAALAGCVRPGGRLLTIGLLSGSPVPWPQVSKRTGVHVGLFHLRHWNARVPVARWRSELERLLGWMAAGLLEVPTPTGRYALPAIGAAVQAAERPGAGKIILTEEQ